MDNYNKMNIELKKLAAVTFAAFMMASSLSACGGSSSSDSNSGSDNSTTAPDNTDTPANPDEQLQVQVLDAYLGGVLVCVDYNNNNECDEEEPSGITNQSDGIAYLDNVDLKNKNSARIIVKATKDAPKKILNIDDKLSRDVTLRGRTFTKNGKIIVSPFTTLTESRLTETADVTSAEYKSYFEEITRLYNISQDIYNLDYNSIDYLYELTCSELTVALGSLDNFEYEMELEKLSDHYELDFIKEEADRINKALEESLDVPTDLLAELTNTISSKNDQIVSMSSSIANDYRCGVTKGKNVMCWGSNVAGTLGNDSLYRSYMKEMTTQTSMVDYYSYKGVTVLDDNDSALSNISKVSTGDLVACAITSYNSVSNTGGDVYCWGEFYNVITGLGIDPLTQAKKIEGITNVVDIAVGSSNICAIKADGDVYCWGEDAYMQNGNGVPANSPSLNRTGTPTKVENISNAKKLFVNEYTYCAIATASDKLYCWGLSRTELFNAGYKFYPATEITIDGNSVSNIKKFIFGSTKSYYLSNDNELFAISTNGISKDVYTDTSSLTDHVKNALIKYKLLPGYIYDDVNPCLQKDTYCSVEEYEKIKEHNNSIYLRVVDVYPGNNLNMNLILEDGSLITYNNGHFGLAGIDMSAEEEFDLDYRPVNLKNVTDISATTHSICAKSNGSYYCWGSKTLGQLGIADEGGYSYEDVFASPQLIDNEIIYQFLDDPARYVSTPVKLNLQK